MIRATRILLAATLALAPAAVAVAGSHEGNPAQKARNAHMGLYGAHLGVLGAMAKGNMEYDAELAAALAGNVAALAGMNQALYWEEGTEAGMLEGSRALPEIWSNREDFDGLSVKLQEAALALQDAAPNGLEAFQPAFGAVGQACGACHKVYRQPE